MRLIDLTGKRFGRLVVLAYAGDKKWSCLCACGARAVVVETTLRTGRIKVLRLSSRELARARIKKHGMSGRRNTIRGRP